MCYLFIYYFICMVVWLAFMSVYNICTWYPQRPEDSSRSLGIEVTVVSQELNLGPLEEQPVL